MGEFLHRRPNANRSDFSAVVCTAQVCAGIGRFLLMLIGVSLIVMPLTQHIWTWDRFLRGGQDFEFGVFAILMALCLVLLLAQHCKQSVNLLLTAWHRLSFLFRNRVSLGTMQSKTIPSLRSERKSSPALDIYNLPLQI
jgi:hypothetical protein